jgi:hypothetical protein
MKGCPYCDRMKRDFEGMVRMVEARNAGNVLLVDAEDRRTLGVLHRFGMSPSGFPSMFFKREGESRFRRYEGDRTATAMFNSFASKKKAQTKLVACASKGGGGSRLAVHPLLPNLHEVLGVYVAPLQRL